MISNAEPLLFGCNLPAGNDLSSIGVEEMIKRISFIFCFVLMVVMMLAVPAFATEVKDAFSIKIIKQPEDCVSLDGNVELTVEAEGIDLTYRWFYSFDDGVTWTTNDLWKTGSSWTSKNADYYNGALFRCRITSSDGSEVFTRSVRINYKKVPFLYSVTECISFVTSWLGTLFISFTSPEGALYPLLSVLAIGIAITVLLLVVKIFKSFSWGL